MPLFNGCSSLKPLLDQFWCFFLHLWSITSYLNLALNNANLSQMAWIVFSLFLLQMFPTPMPWSGIECIAKLHLLEGTFCRTLYRLSYTATLTKFLTHRKLPKRKAWIQFFNSIWRSSWVCFSSSRSMWYFTLIKPENKSFYFELLPASGCLIFSSHRKIWLADIRQLDNWPTDDNSKGRYSGESSNYSNYSLVDKKIG